MAILELLIRQVYENQECLNRFHYVSAGTPAAVSLSFALTYAFGLIPDGEPPAFPNDAPFYQMTLCQNVGVSYIETQAANLYNDTDFYTRPFVADTHGQNDGEPMSPVLALGFFSSRTTRAVRRGFKRFVGVNSDDVGNGGLISEALLTLANEMAVRMGAVLSYDDEGNTLTFTPVVLSYEEYTTPRGNKAYKPYATEAAQLAHLASGISWTPYDHVRSQTSRQYGRGR